jgi:hypothetical protein
MNDSELADIVIARLNRLIDDPAVRIDIGRLIETRISCSDATLNHPTIQAGESAPDSTGTVGFLGVLNGIVGAIDDGHHRGWGYVMAVFDDEKRLERFRRTDVAPDPTHTV